MDEEKHLVRTFLKNYIQNHITKDQRNNISHIGIEPYDSDSKEISNVIKNIYGMCVDYPLYYYIWKDFSNHSQKDWIPITKDSIPTMLKTLMSKYNNLY